MNDDPSSILYLPPGDVWSLLTCRPSRVMSSPQHPPPPPLTASTRTYTKQATATPPVTPLLPCAVLQSQLTYASMTILSSAQVGLNTGSGVSLIPPLTPDPPPPPCPQPLRHVRSPSRSCLLSHASTDLLLRPGQPPQLRLLQARAPPLLPRRSSQGAGGAGSCHPEALR